MVYCTWDNCKVRRKVSLRRRQEVNLISPFRLSYYCWIHSVVVKDLFPSTINCTDCITGWLQTIMVNDDDDRRVRFHDNYSSGVMKIKRKALSLHHCCKSFLRLIEFLPSGTLVNTNLQSGLSACHCCKIHSAWKRFEVKVSSYVTSRIHLS